MGVSGLVNHTHPTFAKFLKNPVMQDALADLWSGTVYGIRMLDRVCRLSQRKENPTSSGQPIMGRSTRQTALIVPRASTGMPSHTIRSTGVEEPRGTHNVRGISHSVQFIALPDFTATFQ